MFIDTVIQNIHISNMYTVYSIYQYMKISVYIMYIIYIHMSTLKIQSMIHGGATHKSSCLARVHILLLVQLLKIWQFHVSKIMSRDHFLVTLLMVGDEFSNYLNIHVHRSMNALFQQNNIPIISYKELALL